MKLQKGFTVEFQDSDQEAEYYRDILQKSEDEEEDEEVDSDGAAKDDAIEKQRQKLLEGLQGEGEVKDKRGADDDIDWDAINSDDLDDDDIDELEQTGKLSKNKEKKNGDSHVTTGFGENVGKKLLE